MPPYGYRMSPHVSASLIHEVRMIIQGFFDSRDSQAMWSSRKERKEAKLSCAPCLLARKVRPGRVVTIFDGRAVCLEHLERSQDGQGSAYSPA